MNDQTTFFGKLGRIIKPRRPHPGLWFREIRILRKLQAGGFPNEVRRITLRKGFNVIWAPPEEADEPELYGDGLSGHASGKTLFCRLLRYLLGETNYGPKSLKESIEIAFEHELWAVAEIFLDEDLWLVARPMAGNFHRFAIKGTTIDDLLAGSCPHGDYNDFAKALESTACGTVLESSKGEVQFGWRYLLPWLARDQESRFSGLTEWRSSLAESENPQTSTSEQHELIKAVIGLLKPEEIQLRNQLHAAEAVIRQANEELPALNSSECRDYAKLLAALKRAGLENLSGLEAVEALHERKENRAEGIRMWLEQAEADAQLHSAQGSWEEAVAAKSSFAGRLSQAQQTLAATTKAVEGRTSRYQRLKASGIPNPARLEQDMCPMSLGHAINRRCTPAPPGSDLETDLNLGEIQSQVDELEQLRKQQVAEVEDLKILLNQSERKVVEKHAAYQKERDRVGVATKQQREWLRQLEATSGLVESAQESVLLATEKKKELANALETRDVIKGLVATHKRDHVDVETALSYAFADAIRAAMGGKVEPSVTVTDRGFTLSVKRKGELSGAALETIKVLAFDLAAMILSVEGMGFHPRFLIHDGPREADMARLIYERFFLYARKLEESFDDQDTASFQ